jgi:hypothetical protein
MLGGISHSGFYALAARGAIRITKIGARSFVHRDEIARVASGGGEAA